MRHPPCHACRQSESSDSLSMRLADSCLPRLPSSPCGSMVTVLLYMVLFWVAGCSDGGRNITVEGKRRRCFLPRSAFLDNRSAGPCNFEGRERDQHGFCITTLVQGAPDKHYTGVLIFLGDNHSECELQRERLWNPSDSFSVVAHRTWTLEQPLIVRRVKTFSGSPSNVLIGWRRASVRPLCFTRFGRTC
jgi:hypothetical protein